MRTLPFLFGLAAIASAAPLVAADSSDQDVRDRTLAALEKLDERGQKIAKRYLKDRVAGEPVSCIMHARMRRSTAASDDVLLYDDGSTVYVNAPYLGCRGARDNSMISATPVGRLCSGDVVLVQDLRFNNNAPLGNCRLSGFVPYRKAKTGG